MSESGAGGNDAQRLRHRDRVHGDGSDVVAGQRHGVVSDVTVAEAQPVTCTITNTRKAAAGQRERHSRLECVLFNDGQPDVAYWGYKNTNDHAVVIPIGDQNTFVAAANGPGPADEVPCRHQVGAFTTASTPRRQPRLDAVRKDRDRLGRARRPATATIELRKVTVPADDPGVFAARINNAEVATGGNGTTSGHLADRAPARAP